MGSVGTHKNDDGCKNLGPAKNPDPPREVPLYGRSHHRGHDHGAEPCGVEILEGRDVSVAVHEFDAKLVGDEPDMYPFPYYNAVDKKLDPQTVLWEVEVVDVWWR